MKDLDEAWEWYRETREQLKLWRRILDKYWAQLPWQDSLERDDRFRSLDEHRLIASSDLSLRELDDLAVLLLFSVFESMVRSRISDEVQKEAEEKEIVHVILVKATNDAIERIESGSFFHVLESYKGLNRDLVEQVNQVRKYRNWVAHGKRGASPSIVDPRAAYDRLLRLWQIISPNSAAVD